MFNVLYAGDGPLKDNVTQLLDSLSHKGTQISVNTSGTTGAPKTITVDTNGRKRPATRDKSDARWLLTYPADRWAGVSVVLHCLQRAATLIVPTSLSYSDLFSAGFEHKVDHISWTPSKFHGALLSGLAYEKLPIKQITFGGEIVSQYTLDCAKTMWPTARVSHVYASAEIGDICCVSDCLAGVPVEKFSGPRFSIEHDGELIVNGIRTGDVWLQRGNRYYCAGRKGGEIRVGGVAVYPPEIEEAALRAGAKIARAFPVNSPLVGSLVGLEYVGDISKEDMTRALSALPRHSIPGLISKVESINLTEAGKIRRINPCVS